MATTDLVRARYAGFDFDTHLDELRSRLQVQFASSFNDFQASSLGMMLLDGVAFGLDTMSFYLDRRATDAYLSTAITRKSVARTTRQLGYKMTAAVASSTDLTVTMPEAAFNIPIYKGRPFLGPNNTIFEAAEDVIWLTTETGVQRTKIIPVYEGESVSETFVSDGTANQRFELRRVPPNKFVVQGTVRVIVNGVPFTEAVFIEFDKTDQFEVGYNDDPATVRFGDGVAGTIPGLGANITVTYVASKGKAGQVAGGTITKLATPLVVNYETINPTITNLAGSSGGDDPETLEHAKVFASRVWKSRYVAVTAGDYEALASTFADPLFGKVAVAQAISSRSAEQDLTLISTLDLIRAKADEPVAPVTTALGEITAALASTAAQVLAFQDQITAITGAASAIKGTAADQIDQVRATRDAAVESQASADAATGSIDSAVSEAADALTDPTNGLENLSPGSITQLQLDWLIGKVSNIQDYLGRARVRVTDISSAQGVVKTQTDADLIAWSSVTEQTAVIGTDTSSGAALALTAIGTAITAQEGDIEAAATDIEQAVQPAAVIIGGYCDDLYDHVDAILSADCKANLVTVPILSRDAAGFFTAPSVGLVRSLQSFLDSKKEVTQTVAVASGQDFLVPVSLTVRVGVLPGYSESVIKTSVEAAIDGILRDRKFGIGLFESDLITLINDLDGVGFVNTTVDSPQELLDADGNIVISASQVLTKGIVTVNVEPV